MNVGVAVWIDGATVCRFIGQNENGEINGKQLPSELKQGLASYRQWVEAWSRMLKKDEIPFGRKSELITRGDVKFLNALQTTGQGNYILEHGGELLEEVPSSEIQDVADYLYQRLVKRKEVLAYAEIGEPIA